MIKINTVSIYTVPELTSYKLEATIIKKLRTIHENNLDSELESLLKPARTLQKKSLLSGTRSDQIKYSYIYYSIIKVLSEDPEDYKKIVKRKKFQLLFLILKQK